MAGSEPRRRRIRRPDTNRSRDTGSRGAPAEPRPPSPSDLAELNGAFALTSGVHDTEPGERPTPAPADAAPADPQSERGLRNLVGGGSSQVTISAALRARDAARPSDADIAAAESRLTIVHRGWVPREDLPARARPR